MQKFTWSVSVVCVFPSQVVLSTCLCSWLSPSFWGLFGDALGGGTRQKHSSCLLSFLLSRSFLLCFFPPLSFSLLSVTPCSTPPPQSSSPLSSKSSPSFAVFLRSPRSPSLPFPVIPSPQAFPALAHQSRQPPRKKAVPQP